MKSAKRKGSVKENDSGLAEDLAIMVEPALGCLTTKTTGLSLSSLSVPSVNAGARPAPGRAFSFNQGGSSKKLILWNYLRGMLKLGREIPQ